MTFRHTQPHHVIPLQIPILFLFLTIDQRYSEIIYNYTYKMVQLLLRLPSIYIIDLLLIVDIDY